MVSEYHSPMNAASRKTAYLLRAAEEGLSQLQGGKVFST